MEDGYEGLTSMGWSSGLARRGQRSTGGTPISAHSRSRILLSRYAVELDEVFDTGDQSSDLLAVQRDQLIFFTESLVYRALPGFFAALRADKLRSPSSIGFLAPAGNPPR